MRSAALLLALCLSVDSMAHSELPVDARLVLEANLVPERPEKNRGDFTTHHLALYQAASGEDLYLAWSATVSPRCAEQVPACGAPAVMRRKVFPVLHSSSDRCGVTSHLAVAGDRLGDEDRFPWEAAIWSIRLEDHSRQRCARRPNAPAWRAFFRDTTERVRVRYGEPEPPKQDCSEVYVGVGCAEVYAPAECTLVSLGGRPLPEPIRAEGSNACHAQLDLRFAACQAGLDWRAIADGDVLCSVTPCPIPSCVAPPPHCHYEWEPPPPNECPTGCGKLVCEEIRPSE